MDLETSRIVEEVPVPLLNFLRFRLLSHQISFVRQYDLSKLQRSLTGSMQG